MQPTHLESAHNDDKKHEGSISPRRDENAGDNNGGKNETRNCTSQQFFHTIYPKCGAKIRNLVYRNKTSDFLAQNSLHLGAAPHRQKQQNRVSADTLASAVFGRKGKTIVWKVKTEKVPF
jgi:hypothetical protein